MAKTFDDGILPVTFFANADHSSYQYRAVTAASVLDYVKLSTGASNPAPIGVQQDDTATSAGMPVSVKCQGFTKARVVALMLDGSTACDIDFGHYLAAASDGQLYYASCGLANARALGFISTGSAIINVEWLPTATCAYSAS